MTHFIEKDPYGLEGNVFDLLHKQTMLITAGTLNNFNTMTASWGGFGVVWNKPVAYILIRPQRYTREFIDANDHFTLSFFGTQQREALHICGKLSGRDTNKVEQAGLTPIALNSGAVAFDQAHLIFDCRKAFTQQIKKEGFTDTSLLSNYPDNDFHIMYVGIIEKVLSR